MNAQRSTTVLEIRQAVTTTHEISTAGYVGGGFHLGHEECRIATLESYYCGRNPPPLIGKMKKLLRPPGRWTKQFLLLRADTARPGEQRIAGPVRLRRPHRRRPRQLGHGRGVFQQDLDQRRHVQSRRVPLAVALRSLLQLHLLSERSRARRWLSTA